MPTLDEIIIKSEVNVMALSEKLKDLDKLRQDIKDLLEQPQKFEVQYGKIVQISEDFTNILGIATQEYLEGNNALFTTNLKELDAKTADFQAKINDLKTEVSRLVNTDFTQLFADLQKDFIGQTRTDLAVELQKFEDKTADFQAKIEDLKTEISRLVNTDFTQLFADLQKDFIAQTRTDLAVELRKFEDKAAEFQAKINDLKTEITRLVNTDFTQLFGDLQKDFIAQTRTDLAVELRKFEDKAADFQAKINDLKTEITRLVNIDFTQLFADLQKDFIAQTRTDLAVELQKFEDKAADFQVKINDLKTEITRLVNTDFTQLFGDLQKDFIAQTRTDLAAELQKFEDKAADFQAKIDDLKTEITRLEKIDLEKHFDKLQKTLSEIFGAINAINLTFTTTIQTLTNIVQSLSIIQNTIDANQKELKKSLDSFVEQVSKRLDVQDIEAKQHHELLENKIQSLAAQNDALKTYQVIQIGLTIVGLVLLIYLAIK